MKRSTGRKSKVTLSRRDGVVEIYTSGLLVRCSSVRVHTPCHHVFLFLCS